MKSTASPQTLENRMPIIVAWEDEDGAKEAPFSVPSSATAQEAAVLAARAFGLPEPEAGSVAVWGRRPSGLIAIREGDRVELTRPLLMDPNEARRLRHERGKGRRRG